jgi:hypothetical protein
MERAPHSKPDLVRTVSDFRPSSADIGPDIPVRTAPTARPAVDIGPGIPIQTVTDDHFMYLAVLRLREPRYLTYSTFAARVRS